MLDIQKCKRCIFYYRTTSGKQYGGYNPAPHCHIYEDADGQPDLMDQSCFANRKTANKDHPLYHFSFTAVSDRQFTPRVPSSRCKDEDHQIPRISFAPSLEQCILAKPTGAACLSNLIEFARKNHMIATGYLYTLPPGAVRKKDLKSPSQLRGFVPDASLTDEHWVVGDADVICEESIIIFNTAVFTKIEYLGKSIDQISLLDYEVAAAMPDRAISPLLNDINASCQTKRLGTVDSLLARPNLLDVLLSGVINREEANLQ